VGNNPDRSRITEKLASSALENRFKTLNKSATNATYVKSIQKLFVTLG